MGEYIPVQTTRVPASWGERYDLAYDRYYSPYCPSLPRQYPRSTSSSRYIHPVPSFLLNIEVHCSLQRPASSSSTAEKRSDAGSRLPEYFTKRRGLSTEEDGDNVRIDVERDGREERVHRVDITARPHHQRVFVKSQSSPQMGTMDRSR